MCYNCGCGEPEEAHDKDKKVLLEKDFEEMAKEWGMDKDTAKKNVFDLLAKQMQS